MFFFLINTVGFGVAIAAGVYQVPAFMFLAGAILATGHFAARFPKLQTAKFAKGKGWEFYPNKLSLYFVLSTLIICFPTFMLCHDLVNGKL